jgi:hypothetical protein
MSSTPGQFANQQPPVDAPLASAALARAWQSQSLYGPAHPIVAQRLSDFCQATVGLASPLRLYAEPGRVVCAGQALNPSDLFAPLASAFQRAGLAIMDIRGQVHLQQAQELLALLSAAQVAAVGAPDVPAAVAQATGGSVRVFTISAEHLRLRAMSPGAACDEPANRRTISLHELHQSNSGPRGNSAAGAPVLNGSFDSVTDIAVGAVLESCVASQGRSPDGADLETIRAAVERLSPDQRRELLEALGCESNVAFDDAARILSLMPVRDVRDAIAVLERPDSRLSSTALMLLRRLAHLTLGSDLDLGRLARVAEDWAADQAVPGEDAGLAQTTAELLKRLNDTEFRSQEYSDLLQQLSAEPATEQSMTCALAADDLAQSAQRVIEVVCESLLCPEVELDAAGPLRFLRDRCGSIADAGDLDLVRRVLAIAEGLRGPTRPETTRKIAGTLIEAAASERWTARALSSIAGEDQVRSAISALRTTENSGADAYVAALSLTRSRRRYRTLATCRDLFSPGELERSIAGCIATAPHSAAALAPFIHETAAERLITLLTPALLHAESTVRQTAFAALEQLGVEWRDDLYVRGALDDDELVRLAAIRAIARRDGRHVRILIDRLAGRIGSCACTPQEREAVHQVLATALGSRVTRRLALTVCMLAIWPMGAGDSRPLEAALRARPRTALSRAALLLALVSPVQIAHRLWNRKAGDVHGA